MFSTASDGARWFQLGVLSLVELLAMSLWFSASAVAPALQQSWRLSSGQVTWLTISVQLGFVAGALASAVLNLSERFAPQRLMAACALLGGLFNVAIALAVSDSWGQTSQGFGAVLGLRWLTGLMLAGVYPTGMKVVASWFTRGRGLAIGAMVGALTIGSASPHLFQAFDWQAASPGGTQGIAPWRMVMVAASASAAVAALLAAWFVRGGPNLPAAARFDWTYFAKVWLEAPLRRANFGYLGHMFELYAMWTWAPRLLLESYQLAGLSERSARLAGFAAVASGAIGCLVAGATADRSGRCLTTIVSLLVSGGSALVAGSLLHQPAWLTVVCLVWGVSIVADSAQFSAAVSELCDPRFVGTALTIQTCAGFLLTTLTIRLVPLVQEQLATTAGRGWAGATAMLALGPIFGIYHMARLRQMDAARRMAGGQR